MLAHIALLGAGLMLAVPALADAGADAVHGPPIVGDASMPDRAWPCPPDAVLAQPAESCDDPFWSAYTSAVGLDFAYLCQENLDFYGELCGVHWWGLALRWNNGWTAGDPAALVFDIVFYADAGGVPGVPICTYSAIVPTHAYRETCFDVYDVYYFEAPPLSPCFSGGGPGWISIQSRQAPPNYDLFLWTTSVTGYSWNNCSAGGGYGIEMWWNNLSGPRDVYVPAYLVDFASLPMDFVATFDVTPMDPAEMTTPPPVPAVVTAERGKTPLKR